MTGKSNEDRYAVSAYRLDDDDSTPSVFAIVADGIGGHKAGEIAAEIAVNTISHAVAVSDGKHPQATLEYAVIQAGEAIRLRFDNVCTGCIAQGNRDPSPVNDNG